jgi:hypothetical protein
MGNLGFGALMTCRLESLPTHVKKEDGHFSELHANSILKQGTGGRGRSSGLACALCHMKTYTSCGIYQLQMAKDNYGHPPLCFFPSKGPGVGNLCFLDYHNDVFFGCNSVVRNTEWVAPACAKRDEHAVYMTELIVSKK